LAGRARRSRTALVVATSRREAAMHLGSTRAHQPAHSPSRLRPRSAIQTDCRPQFLSTLTHA